MPTLYHLNEADQALLAEARAAFLLDSTLIQDMLLTAERTLDVIAKMRTGAMPYAVGISLLDLIVDGPEVAA